MESGVAYGELKAVMMQCKVELVRDVDRIARLMSQVRADERMAASISGAMSDQVRASLVKRAVLVCTPFRTVSWDHARLGAFY